jgi:hypothetical protein
MPGVRIASLAKRFGETSVIEGLDLAVQDLTRVVEDPTEHREQRSRDLDMELTLARRLDPDAAARMADAAQPGPRPGAP